MYVIGQIRVTPPGRRIGAVLFSFLTSRAQSPRPVGVYRVVP